MTEGGLERGRGVAAWRQIADALAMQIRSGALAPGEQLPTEAQFAARFAVNRHTVRCALAALAAGLRACGVHDYRRVSTNISARVATAEEAAQLDLAPGRVVLVVEGVNVDEAGSPIQTIDAVFAADRVQLTVEG